MPFDIANLTYHLVPSQLAPTGVSDLHETEAPLKRHDHLINHALWWLILSIGPLECHRSRQSPRNPTQRGILVCGAWRMAKDVVWTLAVGLAQSH